jgi:hypothetical protein
MTTGSLEAPGHRGTTGGAISRVQARHLTEVCVQAQELALAVALETASRDCPGLVVAALSLSREAVA